MKLPCAKLFLGSLSTVLLCGAWSCRSEAPAPSTVVTNAGELEAPPDPQEAIREGRPRSRLSLMIVSCRPVSAGSVRLDFRIYNFGLAAPVKKWRVTVTKGGHTIEAQIKKYFDKPIKDGPPQYGYLVVGAPGSKFKTKGDLVGVKWNVGYEDPGGLWRWATLGS